MKANKQWKAFMRVVDSLSLIPQSYILQINKWSDWSDSEWTNFIYLVREYLDKDNTIYNEYIPNSIPLDIEILWQEYMRRVSK